MKKIIILGSFLLCGSFLVACSNNDSAISKLQKENSELKAENKKINKKLTAYEGLFGGNDSSDDASKDSGETTSKTFPLNKETEFTSGERIQITSIVDTPSLELSDDYTKGEHAVIVTAIVENTGASPLDFNPQNFDLYDSASQLASFDSSTYSNNIPNSIAAGMKATIVMHFATTGSSPYSLTFGDVIWKQ